jgi:osmotically-inducible protein OsmY
MKTPARAWVLPLAALLLGGCLGSLNETDLSDPGIKARIETELQAQPDLDLKYVTIDVNDGVVTVSGLVNSFAEKQVISRVIRRTRGVEQLLLNVVTQE